MILALKYTGVPYLFAVHIGAFLTVLVLMLKWQRQDSGDVRVLKSGAWI